MHDEAICLLYRAGHAALRGLVRAFSWWLENGFFFPWEIAEALTTSRQRSVTGTPPAAPPSRSEQKLWSWKVICGTPDIRVAFFDDEIGTLEFKPGCFYLKCYGLARVEMVAGHLSITADDGAAVVPKPGENFVLAPGSGALWDVTLPAKVQFRVLPSDPSVE